MKLKKILLGILLPVNAIYASMGEVDFQAYLNRATHIEYATITEGIKRSEDTTSMCIFEYKLKPERKIRGNLVYKITSAAKLAVGERYLFVIANDVPLSKRILGDDISIGPKAVNDASCKSTNSVVVSISEVFPIINMANNQDWIVTLPDQFAAPSNITHIHGFDQVELKNIKFDEPSAEIRDYFKLVEIISLIEPTKSN